MQTRGREAERSEAEAARRRMALVSLIADAGLADADPAFLRGVLKEAALIVPGSAEHARLRQIGGAPGDRDLA